MTEDLSKQRIRIAQEIQQARESLFKLDQQLKTTSQSKQQFTLQNLPRQACHQKPNQPLIVNDQDRINTLEELLQKSEARCADLEKQLLQRYQSEMQLKTRLELIQNELNTRHQESAELNRLQQLNAKKNTDLQPTPSLIHQDAIHAQFKKAQDFYNKYIQLIQKIESAIEAEKCILVCSKGCAVLSMDELRIEILRMVQINN
ncbi:hypothetical protein O5D80_000188 [Batrachochytrium dendrobatidis]|nr:hypothetical protein O5D80_000188 [Batrachochytrium dendrobatidis]